MQAECAPGERVAVGYERKDCRNRRCGSRARIVSRHSSVSFQHCGEVYKAGIAYPDVDGAGPGRPERLYALKIRSRNRRRRRLIHS